MTENVEEIACYRNETVKRCTGCRHFGRCSPRPPRTDFHARSRRPDGTVSGYQARCRGCKAAADRPKSAAERRVVAAKQRAGYHRRNEDPNYRERLRVQARDRKRRAVERHGEVELERRRKATMKYLDSVRSDPKYRERKNASRREARARLKRENPEAFAALRAREDAARARRLKDPAVAARERETRRMSDRLRRQRQGAKARPARRVEGQGYGGFVASAPIGAFMVSLARGSTLDLVSELAGVRSRTVYTWRRAQSTVRGIVADGVFVAHDVLWFEVFDPERFPGVFSGSRARDVTAWLSAIDQAAGVFDGERPFG